MGGSPKTEGPLKNGTRLKTISSTTVTVDRYLAEGGQGYVYIVDYGGEKKALKWYKQNGLGKNRQAFYDNIKANVLRKAPSAEFLWPLDITEWQDDSFGYIMDLRPQGYYELSEFMLTHVRFKSYRTVIDAATKIVSAYRILHNAGLSYQDLNDGNFFINPDNGKVLICDNDNVAPDGTETGILGKPRYMAPEIVLGKTKPNSLTDRFSMSVILFILFCLDHPLEGKRYLVPALTPAMQEELYGSDPIFIMDPDDKRNEPHPVLNRNVLTVWPCLPDYVQKTFLDAFSKKSFEKPSARPSELAWLKILTRFRSEIIPCSCGNEVFTQDGNPCRCDACGRKIDIPFKFELSSYSIPAVMGSRLYRCQLGVCDEKEALSAVGQVVSKKSTGELYIRNKTDRRWDAVTTKGVARKVAPEENIPLKNGITFTIYGEKITIRSN